MVKCSPRPPPSSPDSHRDFFHHKTWEEPWSSADFPLEESWRDRDRRFESRPGWNINRRAQFFAQCYDWGWPWGYFIYRTVYDNVSDEDWKTAMRKLDGYVYRSIRFPDFCDHPEPNRLVCEGYRNVIIEDRELLNGASVSQVHRLFNDWVRHHDQYGTPRSRYCLMIDDKALKSILDSPELLEGTSSWQVHKGYVILIDRSVSDGDITEDGLRGEPNYHGFFHLDISGLFRLATEFSDCDESLQDQIPRTRCRGHIPYTDGRHTRVEDGNGRAMSASAYSRRRDESAYPGSEAGECFWQGPQILERLFRDGGQLS